MTSRGPRHRLMRMATYVLIPGAGSDPWYWHRVVPLLTEPRPRRGGPRPAVRRRPGRPRRVHRRRRRRHRRPPRPGARGAVDGRVHRAARVRPGAGGPAGAGGGHDPAAGRDRRASGGRTPGRPRRSAPQAVADGRDPDDDSVETMFLHDVPPDVAAESATTCADQSGTPFATPWPLARGPTCPPGSCCAATTGCSPPTSSAGWWPSGSASSPTRWTAATCRPSPTPRSWSSGCEAFRTAHPVAVPPG